jgi:hypothetical protein
MWFTFVTARLFHSLSIQPRLAAALSSSCSVANSPIRRVGLSPTLRPASLAQAAFAPVILFGGIIRLVRPSRTDAFLEGESR